MIISLPEEELNAIARAIEPEGFNLVFIKYNRHRFITETVIEFLTSKYPDRKVALLPHNGIRNSYDGFFKAYEELRNGIFFFEGFENVLTNDNFYPSFNIQRDFLATFNISLICFVGLNDAIAECQRKIPDLFSYRAHVSAFSWIDTSADFFKNLLLFSDFRFSTKGGKTMASKLKEAHDKIAELRAFNLPGKDPLRLNKISSTDFIEVSSMLSDCMLYYDAAIWRKESEFEFQGDFLEYFKSSRIAYLLVKLDHYKNALEIINNNEKKINKLSVIDRLEYIYSKAFYLYSKGLYEDALISIKGAIESYIDSPPNYYAADLFFLEGLIHAGKKDFDLSIKTCLRLLQNKEWISLDDIFATYQLLCEAYRSIGNFELAEVYNQKAIKITEKMATHPYVALRHENYALLVASMGSPLSEALNHIGYCIKTANKVFEPNHPFVAKFYYSRARIYYLMGERDKCLYSLRRARKIFEGYYGNEHSSYKQVTEVIEQVISNSQNISR